MIKHGVKQLLITQFSPRPPSSRTFIWNLASIYKLNVPSLQHPYKHGILSMIGSWWDLPTFISSRWIPSLNCANNDLHMYLCPLPLPGWPIISKLAALSAGITGYNFRNPTHDLLFGNVIYNKVLPPLSMSFICSSLIISKQLCKSPQTADMRWWTTTKGTGGESLPGILVETCADQSDVV